MVPGGCVWRVLLTATAEAQLPHQIWEAGVSRWEKHPLHPWEGEKQHGPGACGQRQGQGDTGWNLSRDCPVPDPRPGAVPSRHMSRAQT